MQPYFIPYMCICCAEFNHDSVYCKAVVKSRANVLSTCGFMIDKGMRVPLSNSKKWEYVLARAQHREVIADKNFVV